MKMTVQVTTGDYDYSYTVIGWAGAVPPAGTILYFNHVAFRVTHSWAEFAPTPGDPETFMPSIVAFVEMVGTRDYLTSKETSHG